MSVTRKRVVAAVLTGILILLAGVAWINDQREPKTLVILGLGIVLGTIDTVRGQLPDALMADRGSSLDAGGKIHRDDDPSNLSPRIVLTVIGVAIVAAIIVSWLVLR